MTKPNQQKSSDSNKNNHQSQTFKDLLDPVEPVPPDFNPDQAKAEYLTEKHDLPLSKPERSTFGSAKNSGKIIGDIVEPTSNLVPWNTLS